MLPNMISGQVYDFMDVAKGGYSVSLRRLLYISNHPARRHRPHKLPAGCYFGPRVAFLSEPDQFRCVYLASRAPRRRT
jgi:hypothetical protein